MCDFLCGLCDMLIMYKLEIKYKFCDNWEKCEVCDLLEIIYVMYCVRNREV